MSSAAVNATAVKTPFWRWVMRAITRLLRFIGTILISPVRLYLAFRNTMTPASTSLLVICIVTLNIIWGYPWTGMFSACLSLLVVGWAMNFAMRPRLKIDFTLPSSTPAGQPFLVATHAKNEGVLPAMDLGVDFQVNKRRRRRKNRSVIDRSECQSLTPVHTVTFIHPDERKSLNSMLLFEHRGVHRLPPIVVTSMFPFHLFRSSRRYPSDATIAVTPRVMTGDDDDVARGLLNTLGGWSHRLLSGDALDYTGSREYVVGMPVRRWDFNSWARIGRPIVREFQSPSIQMVMLIVDTSVDESSSAAEQAESVERVLSFAATAVVELTRKTIRVRMYVTSESPKDLVGNSLDTSPSDTESLLIRLAAAESVSTEQARARTEEVVEHSGRSPVLILTPGVDRYAETDMPRNVTIMRVDPAHSAGKPSLEMKSRAPGASPEHI